MRLCFVSSWIRKKEREREREENISASECVREEERERERGCVTSEDVSACVWVRGSLYE